MCVQGNKFRDARCTDVNSTDVLKMLRAIRDVEEYGGETDIQLSAYRASIRRGALSIRINLSKLPPREDNEGTAAAA